MGGNAKRTAHEQNWNAFGASPITKPNQTKVRTEQQADPIFSDTDPRKDVLPSIRTALTRQFYLVYLNSPDWRAKRNQKLREAKFRCERCPSKRELQVHHRTYERFGRELLSDLQVLCANCHRGEHLENHGQTSLGVYLKLASALVRENPFTTIADLSDDIKRRCVELDIPADVERIQSALSVVCGNRLKTPAQTAQEATLKPEGRPLTRDESRELWCRLDVSMGITALVKAMPSTEKTPVEQQAHEQAVLAQSAAMRGRFVRSGRQSVMDRLKDIFEGESRAEDF